MPSFLFSSFLLHISHFILMLFFFSFVYATFLNSRCIFELKFAIYHRAASLSSQASSVDVVLAEESLTRHLFKC